MNGKECVKQQWSKASVTKLILSIIINHLSYLLKILMLL
jgi:hypothetical protein